MNTISKAMTEAEERRLDDARRFWCNRVWELGLDRLPNKMSHNGAYLREDFWNTQFDIGGDHFLEIRPTGMIFRCRRYDPSGRTKWHYTDVIDWAEEFVCVMTDDDVRDIVAKMGRTI